MRDLVSQRMVVELAVQALNYFVLVKLSDFSLQKLGVLIVAIGNNDSHSIKFFLNLTMTSA